MRVVHIVRQFSPSVGGLEDSVLSLARIQREQLGVETRIVTLDRLFGKDGRLPATDEVQGSRRTGMPWKGSTRYPLAPSVLRHLQDADLLHVHAIDFFFDFLAFARPLHGRRMVVSTHGGFFHSDKLALVKRLWFNSVTRLSIPAYARIIACSHSDADMFRSRAGRRLAIIENGINQAKFLDASSHAPSKTIVSFGRFARHKRVDRLFPLLARLRAADPQWRLIVAGRDADQTEGDLRAAASAAGVTEAVAFSVNPSDETLRALLGTAGYFGCLSAHEGFGIAAVEAMSAGLIPILSGITPFRRLASETGVGMIVDPDDLDATAARILAAHSDDPAERLLHREKAIQAARRYDWRTVAASYADLYRDVLGHDRHPVVAGATG